MSHSDEAELSGRQVAIRFGFIALLAGTLAWLLRAGGLNGDQVVSSTVFFIIILGTLFFWAFRLAIAFLGLAALLCTRVLNIPHFKEASSLEVILFLVGMMIMVGALRDLGFFTWIIQSVIQMKGMTGRRFVMITSLVGAALACMVDEVTSILFMAVLIFQVCDTLKIRPTPFLIIVVMATNVGSAGTMLGNPVGIFIGAKAGLTFEDFMRWAFPIMLVSLASTIGIVLFWFRRDIAHFNERLEDRRKMELGLGPTVKVPYGRSLGVLLATIGFIALHHQMESRLGLPPNTLLLMAPLISSGLIMIWRRNRARHYLENEVDWWTLTFFMLLFAVAGTLEYTQVTNRLAESVCHLLGARLVVLVPAVVLLSALGSAFVDNVVFVAAFVPVIKAMADKVQVMPLWWALLFGACFGGNITMIGSTANIVALGMLEKRYREHVRFFEWLKIGVLTGVAASVLAAGALLALAPLMPKNPPPALEAPAPAAPAQGGH
ncbi:MAG TPA: SLC13 family permease [Candidatus Brocadiia bacterium]|nr:SLC13 family permease [Candidatus Brocadiia bacterium]